MRPAASFALSGSFAYSTVSQKLRPATTCCSAYGTLNLAPDVERNSVNRQSGGIEGEQDMSNKVDVLSVMDRAIDGLPYSIDDELEIARAAVAELIEAAEAVRDNGISTSRMNRLNSAIGGATGEK